MNAKLDILKIIPDHVVYSFAMNVKKIKHNAKLVYKDIDAMRVDNV